MLGSMRIVALLLLVACAAGARSPAGRSPTGVIAGLARDRDTGDPIAKAEVRIVRDGDTVARIVTSGERGLYDVDRLAPGRYRLSSTFAGQPLEVRNIDVRPGGVTMVDLVFTLGRPDPIDVDFGIRRRQSNQ
jgi:hypothetical protein